MQQRVPGPSLSQSEFLLEEQETNQATDILIWVREACLEECCISTVGR